MIMLFLIKSFNVDATLFYTILVDCKPIPHIPHLNIKYKGGQTTVSSEAYFTCDYGYVLEGEDIAICSSNGAWHGIIPTCTGSLFFSEIKQNILLYIN